MGCGGYKHKGIFFKDKQELVNFLENGIKPQTNKSTIGVKADLLKESFSLPNMKLAISNIFNAFPDFSKDDFQVLNNTFGNMNNAAGAYVNYINTGVLSGNNRGEIEPIFKDVSVFIKDTKTAIDYANNSSDKKIVISGGVSEFINKINSNDSRRFLPTTSGPEGGSSATIPKVQNGQWFNPDAEKQTKSPAETQGTTAEEGGGTQDAGTQTGTNVNANVNDRKRDGYGNPEQRKADTARYSGSVNKHPERVRIESGEFISWDSDTREWTHIVKPTGNGKWGIVRAASERERVAAEAEHQSKIIDREMFMIIGERGAHNLDKEGGVTTRMKNLNVATQMREQGKTPIEIRRSTGWEMGVDGKWRFEVEDFDYNFTDPWVQNKVRKGEFMPFYSLLTNQSFNKYNKLYPEFSSIEETTLYKTMVIIEEAEGFEQSSASLQPSSYPGDSHVIIIKVNWLPIKFSEDWIDEVTTILTHEIQHAIQYEEGFATGDNPNRIYQEKVQSRVDQIFDTYTIMINDARDTDEYKEGFKNFVREKYNAEIDELTTLQWMETQDEYEKTGIIKDLKDGRIEQMKIEKRGLWAQEQYMLNAGETEARNAQKRFNYSAEQRRDITLEESEDRPRVLQEIVFNTNGPLVQTIQKLSDAGYIDISPSDLYKLYKENFDEVGMGVTEIANAIGTDNYPPIDPGQMNASGIESYAILPDNVINPKGFYENIGFATNYADTFAYIYDQIPEGFNKTKNALKIGLELFYPEKTGLGVFNYLPYTTEEMNDITSRYNEDPAGKLHDVFMSEFVKGEISYGLQRNKAILDTIVEKARLNNIQLPEQYEDYFKATTDLKSFFTVGQRLIGAGDTMVFVAGIDHSDPRNTVYTIYEPGKNAYYEIDMINMDAFMDYPFTEMEKDVFDNIEAVKNALAEIDTEVDVRSGMSMNDRPGSYSIMSNIIHLNIDKLTNRTLYHEAAHAVFIRGFKVDKSRIIEMHRIIEGVLANGNEQEQELARMLNLFLINYNDSEARKSKMPLDELRAQEFLAELVAFLAENEQFITPVSQQSIIDKIVEFFKKVLNWNQDLKLNDINDVIDFINGISYKIRTGETIDFNSYAEKLSSKNIVDGELFSTESENIFVAGRNFVLIDKERNLTTNVVVDLAGKNNDGDIFVDLRYKDGSIVRIFGKNISLIEQKQNPGNYIIKILPAGQQQANPTYNASFISEVDKAVIKDFALEEKSDGNYEYTIPQLWNTFKAEMPNMNYGIFVALIDSYRNGNGPKQPPKEQIPVQPPKPTRRPVKKTPPPPPPPPNNPPPPPPGTPPPGTPPPPKNPPPPPPPPKGPPVNNDPISDAEFNAYSNGGILSNKTVESIARKINKGKGIGSLSPRERQIFMDGIPGPTGSSPTERINDVLKKILAEQNGTKTNPSSQNDDTRSTLEDVIHRISHMDIDKSTIDNFLKTGNMPEYTDAYEDFGSYQSGETMSKKTSVMPEPGTQEFFKLNIRKAGIIGDEILADLKGLYGENYVDKTLELLSSIRSSITGVALMYAVLENDLLARKDTEPDIVNKLVRQIRKVRRSSQAHIRNASVALNIRKLAYIQRNEVVRPTDVANMVFSIKTKKTRDSVKEATESVDINDAAASPDVNNQTRAEKKPKLDSSGRVKSDKKNWQKPKGFEYRQGLADRINEFIKKHC
ncbi:MAG: LPD23 domain-containing protein [Saprospiraceae bacterium]